MAERRYLNVLWETLPLPRNWNSLLNNSIFSGFTAPSYFGVSLLANATRKPIYYLPYYLNEEDFQPIDIKSKLNENVFSILFVGQNTARKGIDEAIISYCRTFSKAKDVQLVIKGFELGGDELPLKDKIKYFALRNMKCDNAPIYLINKDFTSEQMKELYKLSSVLLFPSKGEGFGLPPAEAMLTGLPVIYNDWSGLPDICLSPYNIAVP